MARLIILLSLTSEGAIDTTMQSEKRMASPNTSRGNVRSNPPTNLADFSASNLIQQQFIKRQRSRKTLNSLN
ncbi:hypothetical protein Q5692_35370 [Microcoleus sp. C2C3]|uniref:hypothetical protein n=1 Tax=unclassified Microcoleus TaxID=2642155 RepID=UPI002FD53B24